MNRVPVPSDGLWHEVFLYLMPYFNLFEAAKITWDIRNEMGMDNAMRHTIFDDAKEVFVK